MKITRNQLQQIIRKTVNEVRRAPHNGPIFENDDVNVYKDGGLVHFECEGSFTISYDELMELCSVANTY